MTQKRTASKINVSDITFENVTMNPFMAEDLLRMNVEDNRKIRSHDVSRLANAMLAGEWCLNGSTIKIDPDGWLIDGQHRLKAVISSGCTVPMTIAWGVPRERIYTIDVGVGRSVADHLKFHGESNCSRLAGVVRWYWRWLGRNRTPGGIPKARNPQLTVPATLDVLQKNPGLRESTSTCGKYLNGLSLLGLNGSMVIHFHYLISQKDPVKADMFLVKLSKGSELPDKHPIHILRQRLLTMKTHRVRYPDYEYLALLIITWNRYKNGMTKVNKVHWTEADGVFPSLN